MSANSPISESRSPASGLTPEKPIIGLAGGVGAGKSQAAAEFARLGCSVIASDALSHEILQTPDVLRRLKEWWGDGVVMPAGGPNRRLIAEKIFNDASEKARLESLVYPLIAQRRQDMIRADNQNAAVKAIILDSPLLFESNLDRLCNTVVFVDASPTTRLLRVQRARNWDEAELRRRERWQEPLEAKKARSEFVLNNDGDLRDLRPQVEKVLQRILARFARP